MQHDVDLIGAEIFDTGLTLDEPDEREPDDRESLVSRMIEEAVQWHEENVEPEQSDNTDYYHGRPFGDEKKGRSQVVSTDVRDTARMILPSLMRIFLGGEKSWQFKPRKPSDTAAAEQATEYVNYVIREDNAAFLTYWAFFLDGLVRKVGPLKWWHETETTVHESHHTGVSPEAALALEADALEHGGEAFDVEIRDDGLVDLRVRMLRDEPRVKYAALPPEEFIHSPNSRSLCDARLVGHVREAPAYELIEMGIPKHLVDEGKHRHANDDDDLGSSRRLDEGSHTSEDAQDDATMPVPVAEVYVKLAVDDDDEESDGLVALHKCIMVGGGTSWRFGLEPEIVDSLPMTVFGPSPEPHTLIGLAVADLVKDIQRIKSQVWRGLLDSLTSHLDPAMVVQDGEVNMADVLNQERGRVIRSRRDPNTVMRELTTEFVGASALPVLHELDDMRAMRSGMTKASQGLDPDVMQSTTKAAVTATLSQAQQQIELIARIAAETAIKDLAKGILKLTIRHQDRPRVIRLRDEWVEIDPRDWDATMDVQVNVGLGGGTVEERFTMLASMLEDQKQHIQMGSPMVDLSNLRNTYEAMFELAGRKDIDRFFQTPQAMQQKTANQPPPPPTDAERLEAVEMAKIQQRQREAELRAQIDVLKIQSDMAKERIKAGEKAESKQIDMLLEAANLRLTREIAEADTVMKAIG